MYKLSKDFLLYGVCIVVLYTCLKALPFLSILNEALFANEARERLGDTITLQDVSAWVEYYYQLLQWIDTASIAICIIGIGGTLIQQKQHSAVVMTIRRCVVIGWLILLSALIYHTVKPIPWELYAGSLFINVITCLVASIDINRYTEKMLRSYNLKRVVHSKHHEIKPIGVAKRVGQVGQTKGEIQ